MIVYTFFRGENYKAMKYILFLISIFCMTTGAAFSQAGDKSSANWKLVWSDEFNYNGLPDPAKWDYDAGGSGWGNNELQYYTKADSNNAVVYNGSLHITAKKSPRENRNYTSARLVTKTKGDWTYGKIEVSAKLPRGRGLWPAIWM